MVSSSVVATSILYSIVTFNTNNNKNLIKMHKAFIEINIFVFKNCFSFFSKIFLLFVLMEKKCYLQCDWIEIYFHVALIFLFYLNFFSFVFIFKLHFFLYYFEFSWNIFKFCLFILNWKYYFKMIFMLLLQNRNNIQHIDLNMINFYFWFQLLSGELLSGEVDNWNYRYRYILSTYRFRNWDKK